MTVPNRREVQGVAVPTFLYGTAWKEEATGPLVAKALEAGFRGVDTANQRRHYFEAAVGEAIARAMEAGHVRRPDLFIQTKFTYAEAQDGRLPFDADAPTSKQVEQSFASSLEHLGVDRIDGYLLHGPSQREGLAERDWQAWSAMEGLHRERRAKLIGVSNVSFRQLEQLHGRAEVKPALVQNRSFTRPNADRQVRAFCAAQGILYEGFSLLTGAGGLLSHPALAAAARRAGRTPEQVVFRYAVESGMAALTGTTSAQHMREDLAVLDFALGPGEVQAIERVVGG
jgi:diketogulonate reductase-like aldo/keto reductase